MPVSQPSNKRVQRTRSSPSALRSPLTRSPLGNRTLQRGVSALLLLLACIGCSQTPRPRRQPAPGVAQSSEVTFRIRLAGGQPPEDLSGVDVSLVSGDGQVVRVTTSFAGIARVSKAKIRELRATLILFCSQYTFCGAVPVSQGASSITDWDEYHFELAPLVVE